VWCCALDRPSRFGRTSARLSERARIVLLAPQIRRQAHWLEPAACTWCCPRRLNWRNPSTLLIQPLGGSTIHLRRRYAALPCSVCSLPTMAAVCGFLRASVWARRRPRVPGPPPAVSEPATLSRFFSLRTPSLAPWRAELVGTSGARMPRRLGISGLPGVAGAQVRRDSGLLSGHPDHGLTAAEGPGRPAGSGSPAPPWQCLPVAGSVRGTDWRSPGQSPRP